MRTSFELKITASNIKEAKATAIQKISSFLSIEESKVSDEVNMELKVSYPEAKTLAEITQAEDSNIFVVTVYGSVKQSVAKPFGF
jgi:hypothetical protein